MSRLEMASHDRGYEEGVLAERERCIGILRAYVEECYGSEYHRDICEHVVTFLADPEVTPENVAERIRAE